jgi:hypothetical protein
VWKRKKKKNRERKQPKPFGPAQLFPPLSSLLFSLGPFPSLLSPAWATRGPAPFFPSSPRVGRARTSLASLSSLFSLVPARAPPPSLLLFSRAQQPAHVRSFFPALPFSFPSSVSPSAGRPLGHWPWSRSAAPRAPFPAPARPHWPVPEPPFLLEARRVWIRSTRTSSRVMRGHCANDPHAEAVAPPFLSRPLSRVFPQPPLPSPASSVPLHHRATARPRGAAVDRAPRRRNSPRRHRSSTASHRLSFQGR